MVLLVKLVLFFVLMFLITPVIFFTLVGLIGHYFKLTIDRDSWLAKTEIKWIRAFTHKFVA